MEETIETVEQPKPKQVKFNGLALMHAKRKAEKEAAQQAALAEHLYIPMDEEPEIDIDPEKVYVFESTSKSTAWRHEAISTTNTIFHVPTGRMRDIRYVKVAKSIFVDEQDASLKDYPSEYLGLSRGQLAVNGSDNILMQYLMAHDSFEGNPHRLSRLPAQFRLADKDLLNRKEEKRLKLIDDALQVLKVVDSETLSSIARVVFSITDTDSLAIMNRMKNIALTNPVAILKNVENPKLKRIYVIQQAIDKGVIEIDGHKGSCVWSDTKMQITEVKNTKEPLRASEEVAEYSLTEQGEEFFEILSQKI